MADLSPIVLNAGKRSRRRIRDLKQGTGALADKVWEAVERNYPPDTAGTLQPVVILVRRKEKRKRKRWIMCL